MHKGYCLGGGGFFHVMTLILDCSRNLVAIQLYRVATNLENMENLVNSGNLKNCQNLGKTQGNLNFCRKTQGKCKMFGIITNEKYPNFSLSYCSGKKLKMPWKSQGKLREFSFSKTWPNLPFQIVFSLSDLQ